MGNAHCAVARWREGSQPIQRAWRMVAILNLAGETLMRMHVMAAGVAVAMGMLVLAPSTVKAADSSPVGTWKTVDDNTGKEKALIEISERDGKLQGRIVQLFNPSEPNPVCDKCDGERQGKPIVGMEVLSGLKADGDEWDGGKILDPENGKTYKASARLGADGQTLEVRGYVGVSVLGRTQTWQRASAPSSQGDTP